MFLQRCNVSTLLHLIRAIGLAVLLGQVAACTSDSESPQEPVAPSGVEGYTDADGNTATDPSAVDPTTIDPVADAAAVTGEDPGYNSDADSGEPTGALTDDPLGAPTDIPPMQDETGDLLATPSGEEAGTPPPSDLDRTADDYSSAFGEAGMSGDEGVSPAASEGTSLGRANTKSTANAAASAKGRQVRYVDAIMLNVRARPDNRAPIVRRLLGGAKVSATIQGGWAKLKNGQWVRSRYLSPTPTRRVTHSEADAAWGNVKDRWKKPKKR